MRSIYCGQVNEAHAGQTITLCGWVHRRRDLGGLIFIDMRDREGIVQVFFDPDKPDAFALASELRGEFCIQVSGVVRTRPESQRNSDMATGAIEVDEMLLNQQPAPPNRVNIMSIHQAKGLEFDYVFLASLEDRVFPTFWSVKKGNIEEEKRLFYVAMTRAKKRLYLSWHQGFGRQSYLPSRFLNGVNLDYCEIR